MLSILESLTAIPEPLQPDAVYLGADDSCSLGRMLADATVHGANNPELNRGAVLGPWLSRRPPKPTIVAAMSGTRILDLDDWATPAWIPHLAFYRFLGDERISPPAFTEWGPESPLDELRSFLTDAVQALTITGAGGAFLDWSEGELGAALTVLQVTQPRDRVLFAFHHADGAVPTAEVTRRSGERVAATVRPTQSPHAVESVALSGAETLLSLWSLGTTWSCRRCERSHPPGQARCPAGDGMLFPDLAPDRLWTFRKHRDHWTADAAPRGVVLLDDGNIVLLTTAGATIMEPDGARHALTTGFQRTHDGGRLVRT